MISNYLVLCHPLPSCLQSPRMMVFSKTWSLIPAFTLNLFAAKSSGPLGGWDACFSFLSRINKTMFLSNRHWCIGGMGGGCRTIGTTGCSLSRVCLWLHELQHTRSPCPSPSPTVCPLLYYLCLKMSDHISLFIIITSDWPSWYHFEAVCTNVKDLKLWYQHLCVFSASCAWRTQRSFIFNKSQSNELF